MSLRCLTLVAVCVVFISTEAVSGEDVKKSVGDEVSFRPDKVFSPVSSIVWKHRSSRGFVVKVIEWDVDDGVFITNQLFKDITTLDQKTGEITITNLTVEHSGLYTFDINSKEQEQRFSLEVMVNTFGVLGGTVSFGPASITPLATSITWKHRNSAGVLVKVIEWDGDEPDVEHRLTIPNPRFKDITTFDEKTGQITITNLTGEHSGLYTIDINSKVQGQKYKLEVMEQVPKSEIKIKVVYNLVCEYSETIIWKNSAGETLKGSKNYPTGESLTVENTGNPENFYTCTLKNAVSESTSDPVYERDLFKEMSRL